MAPKMTPPPPSPLPKAISYLPPNIRSSLSRDALRYLASTSVAFDPTFEASGTVRDNKIVRGPRSNLGIHPLPYIILHEGIHGMDNGRSNKLRLDNSTSQMLFNRYWTQFDPSTAPTFAINLRDEQSRNGQPPGEALATLGMNGPEGVPPHLLQMMSWLFNPEAIRQARWNYSHGR